MKSIIFGFSLASVAAAQLANGGVTMVPAPTPAPQDNGSSGYAASASVSAAPASSSAPSIYDSMPYDDYKNGGYKDLECGYGYKKSDDGSCQAESWVRILAAC